MRMGAAGEMLGRLREQAVAMSERARIERAGRRGLRQRRRHRALSDIDLAFREVGEGRGRHPEIQCEHLGGHMAQPIGDREGAELGEIAVSKTSTKVQVPGPRP
jgi:hypothetical protein